MPKKPTFEITANIRGRVVAGPLAVEKVAEEMKRRKVLSRQRVIDVLNKYALLIQGTARKNLSNRPERIDEGTLRASIQIIVSQVLDARLGGIVYSDLEYAPYVHWGTGIFGESPEGGHRQTPWVYYDKKRKTYVFTHGMVGNPFLLDAFNEHKDDFIDELEEVLRRETF